MKLFTDQQYRGFLILLPIAVLLVVLAVGIELAKKPRLLLDVVEPEERCDSLPLGMFNPNEDSYDKLRGAGVPADVAVGIIRWRSYGKVYRIKEDLALVSAMTDSLYLCLEPYIVISDSLRPKPKTDLYANVSRYRSDKSGEHKVAEYAKECSSRGDKWQDSSRSRRNSEENSSDSTKYNKKNRQKELLEINSADSASLVGVYGIGAKSAAEIVKYRDLLGGYHSVEQISELKCITEQNYEKILQQICCDSCKISKIDINFATAKAVGRHPYVSRTALRKIIKQRQLKGGWSRIEEMVEDEILSEDEAKRLAPYLWFRLDATE